MWVVHFALGLTALYAAVITAMYFAQTWLLFPTALAGATPVQPPTSTQYLEVKTHDGESLAGMRIRSVGAKAEGAPTLVGFGGNAWNAWTMALTLHALFPDRDVVTFHYRGYAPSSGRPSANAVLSDLLVIFDHLRQTQADEPIIAVGFSIGSAVAAYLARHRPVVGLILVTPFDSLETWPAISTGGLLSACFSTIVCPRSSSFAARSRPRPSSLRSATESCRRGERALASCHWKPCV